MTLQSNTYGTVRDVERMVADLVRSRAFSDGNGVWVGNSVVDSSDGVRLAISTDAAADIRFATEDDVIIATSPTRSEIIDSLNRAADMINSRLLSAGYVVPISLSEYPATHGWAKEVNAALVAARTLNTQPNSDRDLLQSEDEASTRSATFLGQARDFFAYIENGQLDAERASASIRRNLIGAYVDRDPIFTIGMLEL